MQFNSYQLLMRALGIVHKITTLSALTDISKSTLTNIAKGRGNYEGCLSTRMRLEDFISQNENRRGRPYKKEETNNV